MQREVLDVQRFSDGAEFRDFFKRTYGPTISTYKAIAEQPERVAELDGLLADLGDRYRAAGKGWEYLLTTGTVR